MRGEHREPRTPRFGFRIPRDRDDEARRRLEALEAELDQRLVPCQVAVAQHRAYLTELGRVYDLDLLGDFTVWALNHPEIADRVVAETHGEPRC